MHRLDRTDSTHARLDTLTQVDLAPSLDGESQHDASLLGAPVTRPTTEGATMIAHHVRSMLTVIAVCATVLATSAAASATSHSTPKSDSATSPVHLPLRFAQVSTPVSAKKPGHGPNATSVVYPPAVIARAYDYPSSTSPLGTGETIAIIDAYGDPTLASDLSAFDTRFSLSDPTLNVSYPDGQPGHKNSGWAVETALDVEWAHASAPGATIDVVVAPDASLQHLLDALDAAIGLNPTAVSMSWGADESGLALATCTVPDTTISESCQAAYEDVLASAPSTMTLFASSGDQGAFNGTHPKSLSVSYPASSPEVVGVGGTTLTVDSSNGWAGETAWSGSGGGYSTLFDEPTFQSGAGISDTSGMRGVPDAAFDADPSTGVYVVANGRWYGVGGTSVGAPNWAGLAADAAASSKSMDASTLYGLMNTSISPSSYYHDVTSGSNGYYTAGTGWDAVTGLGSPDVAHLIEGL